MLRCRAGVSRRRGGAEGRETLPGSARWPLPLLTLSESENSAESSAASQLHAMSSFETASSRLPGWHWPDRLRRYLIRIPACVAVQPFMRPYGRTHLQTLGCTATSPPTSRSVDSADTLIAQDLSKYGTRPQPTSRIYIYLLMDDACLQPASNEEAGHACICALTAEQSSQRNQRSSLL